MQEDVWDGDWVLFCFDPESGVERWYNPKENLFRNITHTDQIEAANKQMRAESVGQRWGDGRVVASVPLDMYYSQLEAAVQQQDHKYISQWINDSDHRAWRTREGRI